MGYSKLFSEIVMSTVWREPNHVRLVWITMLAIKDRFHVVNASLPGLADAARVSMQECEEAIRILSDPDPHSRTLDNEGRRIKKCDGGWVILNGEKYRNKMSLDERREYQRIKQREYRNRKKAEENQQSLPSCQQSSQQLTHTDTDTDTNKNKEQKNESSSHNDSDSTSLREDAPSSGDLPLKASSSDDGYVSVGDTAKVRKRKKGEASPEMKLYGRMYREKFGVPYAASNYAEDSKNLSWLKDQAQGDLSLLEKLFEAYFDSESAFFKETGYVIRHLRSNFQAIKMKIDV